MGSYIAYRVIRPSSGTHVATVSAFHNPVDTLKELQMDIGANVNVCPHKGWFEYIDYSRNPTAIGVNATNTVASGVGTTRFCPTDVKGQVVPIVLTDVWCIPQQPHSLISVSRLEDLGATVEISTRTVNMAGHQFHFARRGGTYPRAETNTIAAVRPRISRDRADWQLFGSVFTKLADKFSTGDPNEQWWELFRKAGNEVCTAGFDVTNSASGHSWTGRAFYGNPPLEEQFIYRMLDKALADFSTEPQNTRFLFILPYWPQSNWYRAHCCQVRTWVTSNRRKTDMQTLPRV